MYDKFFLMLDGEQQGPFSIDELETMSISKETPVWANGMPDWQKAEAIPELFHIVWFDGPSPGKKPVRKTIKKKPDPQPVKPKAKAAAPAAPKIIRKPKAVTTDGTGQSSPQGLILAGYGFAIFAWLTTFISDGIMFFLSFPFVLIISLYLLLARRRSEDGTRQARYAKKDKRHGVWMLLLFLLIVPAGFAFGAEIEDFMRDIPLFEEFHDILQDILDF